MRNIMHDNRDFYQLLFENSADPIIIVKNNQFIDCNAATLALLAYPNKQEFLKLGPSDISPPFQADGACSKEKAADIIARTLSSGFECFEWTHQRTDGELVFVQIMLTVMVVNNETLLHAVLRNIRQQQSLSDNLQQSLKIAELKSTFLAQQNKQLSLLNQRYQKSFEFSPLGIVHLSPNGHFLEVNEGFCHFIGYSHEQLFALNIKQLEWPLCAPILDPLLKALDSEPSGITQEISYRHKNGHCIWGRSTLKAIKDASGQIDYVLQLLEDITQYKADQQQLIKLSQAVEQSPSLIVITDLLGNIEYVNASFIALSGYSKEELLGNNQRLLKSGKTSISTYESMYSALREGQNWHGEFINYSKLGKEYRVATHISPIRNDRGEISHYLGVKEDITERRALEQALLDSQTLITSILDSLPAEIAVINHDGIIIATNQPWRDFGNNHNISNTFHDWQGINYLDYCTKPDEMDLDNKHFAISAAKGIKQVQNSNVKMFRLEYPCHIETADIWFEMQVNALNSGTGNIIIQHTNINKFKQIEFELKAAKLSAEHATSIKADFLATMSHEIRTPMNAIIGFSELALYQDFSAEALEYFAKINGASTNLLSLLNDILDLSRLDARGIILEPLPFQLDNCIESLRTLFSDTCSSKGLSLHLTVDDKVPMDLIGDAKRLQQILINLLGNAIKFTDSGSVTLAITLQEINQSQAHLLFSIKDTGIGIASEQQHKLFIPFSQVNGSITRRYGGSGLGLTICNQLLQLMDSKLNLSSVPEQGSIFSFELILEILPFNFTDNTPKSSLLAIPFNEISQSLAGYKVLVVEDNKINQQVIETFLSLSGILVSVANNGVEALEQLAENEFAAVLMDMHMPVMDGFEATLQLRLDARFKNLPILALSSGVTPEEQAHCLAAGINEFISKPINPHQLLNTLIRWIKPEAFQLQQAKEAAVLYYDDLVLFDVDNLLSLLGNNQTFLVEILQEFKISMQNFLPKLNDLLLAQDRLAIKALVHDLKGTAANMGAVRLHAAVSDLDAELKIRLPDEASVQRFSQIFIATMASLDKRLKASE